MHSIASLTTSISCLQMWMNTRKQGLPPNYGSSTGDALKRRDQWHHMVSDVQNKNSGAEIAINQDANIFVTEISASTEQSITLEAGR